jgi:nucleotide-binding universal stress UspA family protein
MAFKDILSCETHVQIPGHFLAGFLVGRIVAGETAKSRNNARDLLAAFDTAAEKAGVSHEAVFEKRATIDFPDLLVDNARPRDLTIVPAEERAKILCHHGIESYWDKVDANGRPTGEVLDSYALCYTIDLLVMGAYGHSRLRELILAARPKACFQSLLFRPCSPLSHNSWNFQRVTVAQVFRR